MALNRVRRALRGARSAGFPKDPGWPTRDFDVPYTLIASRAGVRLRDPALAA